MLGVMLRRSNGVKDSSNAGRLSSRLLNEAIKLDALYLSTGVKVQEFGSSLKHKRMRFILRAFRGVAVGVAKRYRFRWFVLTESDEAISAGLVFGKEFNRFLVWLRYHCPDFQYIVVEHRQGDLKRRNWHVLSYGSDKLPVLAMRNYWQVHFKSTVTGMAEVRNIRRAIFYLAKYLSNPGFVRSWCSQGWVYPGWVGDSRLHNRIWHEYPLERVTTALALMSPDDRRGYTGSVYRGYGLGKVVWDAVR